MSIALAHRPPPAGLRPQTHVTARASTHNLVRVRTNGWDRVRFFGWLDHRIIVVGIPDMQTLADLSGVSHSALSNWRSGKYRPKLESLSALAKPLKTSEEVVWAEAGILPAAQLGVAVEEDLHIRSIRESSLSKVQQDRLIAMYQEDLQRAVERSRQQLELLGGE